MVLAASLADLPLPLIVGLAIGSFYALIALCFHLIFASAHAVNFAQGQLFMYGALLYATFTGWSIPTLASIGVVVVCLSAIAVFFALVLFQPLNKPGVPHLALAMTPIAAGAAMDSIALQVWGGEGTSAPSLLPDNVIRIGNAAILPQHLVIIGVAWSALLAVWLLFERTHLGTSIRAVAANQYAARLQGVNVTAMVVVTFAITGVISAIGGALVAPLTGATTTSGAIWSIQGVLAAVFGGLTTARGAVIGGVILGLGQQLTTFYVSSNFSQMITLSALVVFLILRPEGLVGSGLRARV